MGELVQLIGYIAWPITAIVLTCLLVREIKAGLVQTLFQGIGSLRVAGFELTKQVETAVQLAKSEAQAANIEVVPPAESETIQAEEGEEELSANALYDQIQDAWTEIAEVVTDLAVQHGGYRDQRKVRENLLLLVEKGAIEANLFDVIRSIQQLRNGIRRAGPGSVSVKAVRDYKATVTSVAEALRERLSPAPTA
ncbi:hypothetical protein [Xanthobacter versatilis]|uniref:hypothetical protein n=1 Tax=Xanthobacter autotrophicus (strain ATCC BAA-1158 / Py2) TaxID=78245 RepID=UPI00372BE663